MKLDGVWAKNARAGAAKLPGSQMKSRSNDVKEPVLLGAPLPLDFQEILAERYELVGPIFREPLALALAKQRLAPIRALVTMGSAPTDRAIFDALPDLGLVVCYGSGYEGVDLAAAAARGIKVAHARGATAASVADFALGLMLAAVRNIASGDRYIRRGLWDLVDGHVLPLSPGLKGRRLGIFGLGAIGLEVARRGEALGMEIAYHNRQRRADVDFPYHPTLLALADWADILVIAVRASAETRHAVGARELSALGPMGYLVNIARGSVIDQAALVEALDARRLAGAGLDVFETEPIVPPELLRHDNVVVTPHIAARSRDAQEAMRQLVVANLAAFFAGEELPTLVPFVSH